MPSFPRVTAGAPFRPSASSHNRMATAVELVEAWHRSSPTGRLYGHDHKAIVDVANDTGADIPMFGVVAPNGLEFTPSDNLIGFQNNPLVTAAVPSAGTMGRFGIAMAPIGDGRVGPVLFSGMAVCKVQITDPNVNEVAEIVGQTDRLVTAAHGTARIIARESGSGTVWALVQLGVGRDTGIRWKPISSSLVVGSSPARYKYTLQRVACAADGSYSIPSSSEQVYGFSDWEDQTNPWHGQSDILVGGATISVDGPVTGPVKAEFCGVFDAGDGKPIYRFDAPNPMQTECGGTLDAGPITQSQVEDIAEGT